MEDIKKDILWRVYLVYFAVLIFGIAVIAKAAYIQIAEGEELLSKANVQEIDYFTISANRGNILACDGRLLASTIPVFEIRMDVNSGPLKDKIFNEGIDSLALCLSKLFKDKSKSEYKNEFLKARREGNRYLLIQRNITYEQLKELKKFPIFRLGRFRGGLIVNRRTERILPYDDLAQRTIGYQKETDSIFVGLEGKFNEILKGKDGKELRRRINHNDWMPVSEEYQVEPEDGLDVVTTIDINIQDVAEDALRRHLAEHEASQGCAVLMEVRTGEIRAIANLKLDTTSGQYKEVYNYAVGEKVEPGSTFKLASMISVLEDRLATPENTVYVGRGEVRYHNRTMRDVHKFDSSYITIRKAFEESSNVGISQMIYTRYNERPEKYVEHLYALHLNEPLDIEIPGEGKPFIKHPSDRNLWSGVSLPWMSIGYEVSITPLQILTLYNAVANNGVMVKPRFVREIRQGGYPIQEFQPFVIDSSICSQRTLETVKSLLEGVVENGTGSYVKNPVYKVAGKTGTALVADRNKGYAKRVYNASFVGYFPADNPRYSCIVVVNHPKKGKIYGGSVSAPVFKEIADKVYASDLEIHDNEEPLDLADRIPPDSIPVYAADARHYLRDLDIPKYDKVNSEWVYTVPRTNRVLFKPIEIQQDTLPDLKGWTARDAVYLLETMGMVPLVKGKGRVESQSVPPGTRIAKGSEITINLVNTSS